jgi:hypothetical protein
MDILETLDFLRNRDRCLQAAWKGEATMPAPASQSEALVAAAEILERLGVGYMLIGGVAVALHAGLARLTVDVDFAVRSDVTRDRIAQAFVQAGFRLKGIHLHTVNLLHSNGEPVQLAFDPGFDPAIERATTFSVRGRTVRIVTKDDLIELKRRAAADPGRRRSKALQDQADVELLRGDVPDPDEGW